jgi:hypothetical protein
MSKEGPPKSPPVIAVEKVVELYQRLDEVKDLAEKEKIQRQIKATQQAGHIKI